MRKKDQHLQALILDAAREIVQSEGMNALNIREIARQAGIASGTVYNYFPGKDHILLALTEEYWREALTEMKTAVKADSFCGKIEEIYGFLHGSISRHGGMLMESLSNVTSDGLHRMESMQAKLQSTILEQMDQDPQIKKDIWNEDFTKEQYADFILANMVLLLKGKTPQITFLTEIIKRTLY